VTGFAREDVPFEIVSGLFAAIILLGYGYLLAEETDGHAGGPPLGDTR
jgi:hypothetical protein